jgi:drug/metabolite transporter (DMT)-like permease
MMNLKEWGYLLLLSVLFGGSFFFVGVAVEEVPTFSIVVIRVGIAAVVLHAVNILFGSRIGWNRELWISFFVMAVLNNVIPFSLIVWGQENVASGIASVLNASAPLFGVVVTQFLTQDEKMTAVRVIGVITGFAGVTVMIGFEAFKSLGIELLAPLAIVFATLSYAFASVYGRNFRKHGVPPLQSAVGQVTASTVVLIPLALAIDQPWIWSMPGFNTWLALFGLGALSTALAFVVYFRILATAGANNLLLVTFLIPVTAILLGIVVLEEELLFRHAPGMLLIALGLAILDGRPLRRVRRLVSSGESSS